MPRAETKLGMKVMVRHWRTQVCFWGVLVSLTWATPLFVQPKEELSAPFTDGTTAAGIHFVHQRGASIKKHLVETMGSGCAFLDYDADGWLDLLLVNGGSTPDSPPFTFHGHALYSNLGNGKFTETSAKAGIQGNGSYGMGVAVGDYDNDGYPDVYITTFGTNILYHNNKDGTFTDVASTAGVAGSGWNTSAAFFDFDNDGYLDLYVTRYVDYDYRKAPHCAEQSVRTYCHPKNFPGVTGRLYRNLGNGRFQDVSKESGVASLEGKGLGVVAADFNEDGWMDLYLANDTTRNVLLKNNGNGSFTEMTLLSGTGYNSEGDAEAGMGTDAADYNGDGKMDLVVTNYDLESNALYRNEGNWLFSDDRWLAGIARADHSFLGFGTGFLDFDNDGDNDLLVANGHVLDNADRVLDEIRYSQPVQLFENQQGRFTENGPFQRFASLTPRVGRGMCFGDIDNDGDVDVLISNSGQAATLLRNEAKSGNWLLLKLVGTRSNRDAIGARVTVVTENGSQTSQVRGGRSYLSASDQRVHFGLGSSTSVKLLKVTWPSGTEQTFENLKSNQVLRFQERTSALPVRQPPQ